MQTRIEQIKLRIEVKIKNDLYKNMKEKDEF